MKIYYHKDDSPLIFHEFYCFLVLPLTLLSTIGNLIQLYTSHPQGSPVDILVSIIDMVLIVVCIVDLARWRPLGWYAVMVRLWFSVGYAAIVLLMCMINAPQLIATALGQVIGTSVFAVLIGIYYIKRKPLFVPVNLVHSPKKDKMPVSPDHDHATIHQVETPPIAFCRKCGSSLPPDSDSCSNCGTTIAKE